MAMNRIQFQPGLSMPEFLKDYGTEAQCEQALKVVRWSEGFRWPRCAGERTLFCAMVPARSFSAAPAGIRHR